MRAKHLVVSLLVLIFGIILTGCAGITTKNMADTTCTSNNANSLVRSGYHEKIHNFIIVQDASSTMGEGLGNMSNYDSKLSESKDLLNCLNNSLPDQFDAHAGMRVFGPVHFAQGLVYGMTNHTKADLMNSVKALGKTGGVTPLTSAVTFSGLDLLDTKGKKAMILFSDGMNTDAANPAAAAAAVKEEYGDNICIYTVLIGDDTGGRATMQQIADAGKCGFATDSATIGNAGGMDQFVKNVFLHKTATPAPPPPPAPRAKPAEPISMTLYFEFDFDKDVVRAVNHGDAKRIADALNKYPGAKAVLEGHTDSMGSDSYNMNLSQKRSSSVKRYVVEKFNINASRISTVGYGESKPVATNDTDAGRQRNRRVVAIIK